ncbi:MAG: hypothetical protein AVDCRST_MAG41-2331, partial [uncultured Corynebacteriales bacterium]
CTPTTTGGTWSCATRRSSSRSGRPTGNRRPAGRSPAPPAPARSASRTSVRSGPTCGRRACATCGGP